MTSRARTGVSLLAALVAVVVVVVEGGTEARTHPGGTDEEGCHTCRTHCERWDEEAGERHCHEGDDEADSSGGGDEDQGEADAPIEISEGERAYVEKVLDGDTLVVRVLSNASEEIRIRLLGIDCPESHVNPKCRREGRRGEADCAEQIPEGRRAAERAAELVKHEVVRLESEGGDGDFERGNYDRVLSYVRLEDGRDFGRLLVAEGHCADYGDTFPHPRQEAYERVERDAS